jgi:hypothetical protein
MHQLGQAGVRDEVVSPAVFTGPCRVQRQRLTAKLVPNPPAFDRTLAVLSGIDPLVWRRIQAPSFTAARDRSRDVK